ncbi:MAG: 2-oxoglutarate dehydrogenase E1 component, partial [Acidobacteriota bacterium]
MNPDSLRYVEALQEAWRRDPSSVPEAWRRYFEGGEAPEVDGGPPEAEVPAREDRPSVSEVAEGGDEELRFAVLQDRVDQLIRGYRVRGHLAAQLDPLGRRRPGNPELELQTWGLGEEDLSREFSTRTISGPDLRNLGDIVDHLRETYCRSIGVQFMHIDSREVRIWLQDRMESTANHLELSRDEQLRILGRLSDAETFEAYLRRKFIGAKTFSLEGAESLIPLLDLAFDRAAEQGVREIVMGMAHRGRLNVLANILGKRDKHIFLEFDDEDLDQEQRIVDDVRYHLGYGGTWTAPGGEEIHASLCFNPSHLEFVNPVALGRVRAKQLRFGDEERRRGMTLLIHGDAAFAGEGIVQETLNFSRLPGYTVGGTVHVVVNNQLGFTTEPEQGRSTRYATDVARMLQIPIFHVNGEDPEAVAQVVRLAMDFRHRFRRDVVIDLYCYRRLGHNEGDEPSFTQPRMYERIQEHPTVRESYQERLCALGEITEEEAEEMAERRRERLESEFEAAKSEEFVSDYSKIEEVWSEFVGGDEPEDDQPETGVSIVRLGDLLHRTTEVPEGFNVHRKLERFRQQRREMAESERPLDWSTAEALAFASLATDGYPVRLTGQDSERGTFSQRHAVLHDTETGERYMPLAHLHPSQAPVEIVNSPLSEAGVLGYEYGFSLDYPDALVAWEAQFGDFWNAAQVVVDQFLASAEEKWARLSGLVMLLPHGYEGQGPEHSSARPERLLQLSTGRNLQVVYPTTPAQYFHVLRRQVLRRWRKPLIVLTPKSMLRNPRAVSPLHELGPKKQEAARGRFKRALPDDRDEPTDTRKILLCSGKLYWELLEKREELEADDVAIVRLEQLAPFPWEGLEKALEPYDEGTPALWVQEEPRNMGAWHHVELEVLHRGERLLEK